MTSDSPTAGTPSGSRRGWGDNPWASFAIRFAVFLTPIALSFGATWFLAQRWPAPSTVPAAIIRFLILAVVAVGVGAAADRGARRFLPLAALFRLSLVFPDQAPSRFSVALRSGNTRRIEHRLAEVESGGFRGDEAEAAQLVVEFAAALSKHDRLTRGHSERVRAYTALIAEEMGLSDEDSNKLQWAGLIHDVGKLRIPQDILTKSGALTPEEFEVVKTHPAEGMRLAAPLANFLGPWIAAVGEHHERFDGMGYPNGIAGTEIGLAGRIVAVADAYDVITAARSYKKPLAPEFAREELSTNAGSQFDPVVVRAFLSISLGRLRRAMWPLSWMVQVPFLGTAITAPIAQTVAATIVTIATATGVTVATGGFDALNAPEAIAMVDTVSEESLVGTPVEPLADQPTQSADSPDDVDVISGPPETVADESGGAADIALGVVPVAPTTSTPATTSSSIQATTTTRPGQLSTSSSTTAVAQSTTSVASTNTTTVTPATTTTTGTPATTTVTPTTIASSTDCQRAQAGDTSQRNADLRNCDLSSLVFNNGDFYGANLTGAVFDNTSLIGGDFVGATFDDADFIGADVQNADFSNTSLVGTSLSESSLVGVNLSSANFTNATITNTGIDSDLTDANLNGTSITSVGFEGSLLSGVSMRNAVVSQSSFNDLNAAQFDGRSTAFYEVTFENSILNDASFANAQLTFVVYTQANLMRAKFSGAAIVDANFYGVNAQDADFAGANMHKINMNNINGMGTDFSGARLDDGSMIDSTLTRANFVDTTFVAWDFNGANVSMASFAGSSFTTSSLQGANARGTTFTSADFGSGGLWLFNATLRSANFQGATGVPSQPETGLYNKTTCPDGSVLSTPCW